MALSRTDIQKIHADKKAIYKKLYYGEDGETYLGTINNRLRILDKAEVSIFKATERIQAGNTQKAIEELSNLLDALESSTSISITNIENNIDVIETTLLTKADKCFTMAMAIAL